MAGSPAPPICAPASRLSSARRAAAPGDAMRPGCGPLRAGLPPADLVRLPTGSGAPEANLPTVCITARLRRSARRLGRCVSPSRPPAPHGRGRWPRGGWLPARCGLPRMRTVPRRLLVGRVRRGHASVRAARPSGRARRRGRRPPPRTIPAIVRPVGDAVKAVCRRWRGVGIRFVGGWCGREGDGQLASVLFRFTSLLTSVRCTRLPTHTYG